MRCKIATMDVSVSSNYALISPEDGVTLGVDVGDRVYISGPKGSVILFVALFYDVIKPGQMLMSKQTAEKIGVKDFETVDIVFYPTPPSVKYIRKKMDGNPLTEAEITEIVNDIQTEKLSFVEVSTWVTSVYAVGMNFDEMKYMAMAMSDTSKIRVMYEKPPIFDFQSLHGVAGNKITPIIVSIVAAAGFTIPNMSSNAITGACGTADFMDTICNTMISTEDMKRTAENIGGCIANDAITKNIADMYMTEVDLRLGINPHPIIISSIVGKKLQSGITCLLVDIPMGRGTGIKDMSEAKEYMHGFVEIGKKVGMHIETVITQGDTPIGSAVGPKLEAIEFLRALEGCNEEPTVVEKACEMAGIILEMGGKFNGKIMAHNILKSGKAMEKFREIVKAQGGNENIKSSDLEPGKYRYEVKSSFNGYVERINNADVKAIAKMAGSPIDRGAGVLIKAKKGCKISQGDTVLEIYADYEEKCQKAAELAKTLTIISTGNMLIERVGEEKV